MGVNARTIKHIRDEASLINKMQIVELTSAVDLVDEAEVIGYNRGKNESVPLKWGEYDTSFRFCNSEKICEDSPHRNWMSYQIRENMGGIWADLVIYKGQSPEVYFTVNAKENQYGHKDIEEAKMACQEHYDRMSGR